MQNINAPMRVLMITSEWPTEKAPNDVPFLVRQVSFLRRAGVDVEVFHFHGAKNPFRYIRAWIKARRKMSRNRYDLVHAQFGQSALLAIPKRLPLLITIRGDDVEGIVDKKGRYTVAGYVLRLVTRAVARWADDLIVVSPHMKRHFLNRRVHVIPSGLDLNLFSPMRQEVARQKLGLPLSKRLVLFVGNPEDPRKGFSLAQKAMAQLDKALNAELVVAWNLAHSDIPAYMNACDVMVFTSMHEGSPNVVKEALACNLPVVSVVVGDVPDRLKGLEGCAVCEDNGAESVASSLTQVLWRKDRPASRFAVSELDERILTERVIKIYKSISRNSSITNLIPTDGLDPRDSAALSTK